MDNIKSTAFSSATNTQKREMDKVKNVISHDFNFYGKGTAWGVQAGAAMGLFLIMIQLLGGADNIFLKYLTYAILIGFIGIALNTYKNYVSDNEIFQKGLLLGGYVTIVSGLTYIVISAIAFVTNSSLAFEKFGIEANSTGEFLLVSGVTFFEILVFGMIITFIYLQYLKSNNKPNEGILED